MRVIAVTGGRHYDNREALYGALDWQLQAGPIGILAHGGASGADKLADEWAAARGIERRVFEPDWPRHGRGAGPQRNQRMLEESKPAVLVAFPGGKGTADCVRRALKMGILVTRIGKEQEEE